MVQLDMLRHLEREYRECTALQYDLDFKLAQAHDCLIAASARTDLFGMIMPP